MCEENILVGEPESKDAETGACLVCLGNSEEGSVVGAEGQRGKQEEMRADRKQVLTRLLALKPQMAEAFILSGIGNRSKIFNQ